MEILARQLAYEYNIGSALSVLFSYRGTFWPHVLRTHELYMYPLLHTGLVLVQWRWQEQAEEQAGGVDSGRGTFWRTFFEVTADEDGLEVGPQQYWEKNNMMIPWKAVGALTPLMVFALVFFLSQCYSRFMTFFYACQLIETAIQDLTVLMLVHAKKHKHRWDAVRYLTAAAMTTYGRVTDLANVDEDKRRRKPAMDFVDWERLLLPERTWHKQYVSDAETWDTILGWPRSAGLVEEKHTAEMHAAFGTSPTPPERPSSCPPLLNAREVDELRHYPDSMVGLVLVTWCVQTLKELELNGQLKGPSLGQAQGALSESLPLRSSDTVPTTHVRAPLCVPGSAFKLRAASCKICNLLNLPIPLPYFHTLVVLQNVCFSIMSWSLLSFVSFLTPIVLFFAVLVMVGLREVAVALSNPFGNDDVDFPIDKWVAQLRANALLVHRENRVVRKPKGGADFGTGLGVDDDDDEEEEDEDGGAGGGAGGDAGGGGGGGDDGDDGDEGEKGF